MIYYITFIISSLFIGYGTNWMVGVGAFLFGVAIVQALREVSHYIARNLTTVNNNLASKNPQPATFNPN